MSTTVGFSASPPGFTTERLSAEAGIFLQTAFQGDVLYAYDPIIDSTATDVGNTSYTSVLRPGLVMGRLDATGNKWVDYDKSATDGSQQAQGVLIVETNLIDYTTGSAADRQGIIAIQGKVRADMLVLLDQQARNQLTLQGFIFSDAVAAVPASFLRVVEKAANYTVTAADNGILFVATTGAVNFTLPTPAVGLVYEFFNAVDATMAVLSAGSNDDIIVDGDLAADSITFSTASHKIGAHVRLTCIYIGGALKWMVTNMSIGTTQTVA